MLFYAYFSVSRKRNFRRSQIGTKSTGEVKFWKETHLIDLECTSGESRAAHEGGGAPYPPRRAPCLVSTPEVHRRTPCTQIYLRTQKLPKQNIDREFRHRKPPEPRKTSRDPVPAPCRRGDPSPVAIFIIPALSMTRRE